MRSTIHRSIRVTVLAAGIVAMASTAHAEEGKGRNTATVALGAALLPTYSGSDDYVVTPGLVIQAQLAGFQIFSRGTYLMMDVIRDDGDAGMSLDIGPVAGVRLERSGRIGDSQVRALGELDAAWEIGGWAGVSRTGVLTSSYDRLSVRTYYVADVGSAHKSYVITPEIEYGMPLSQRTLIGLSLSADYVGKGYGRHYFDVTPAGSLASGLAAYAGGGKAGFAKIKTGLLVAQSLSGDLRKGWALVAGAGYGRILGRYARSPIVKDAGSRNQWLGTLGIAYSF